jgi:hypothetical protein
MDKLNTTDVYTYEIVRGWGSPLLPEGDNEVWGLNGCIHRDGDQPAIVCSNGDKYWYQHGRQERDGDRPVAIYKNSGYVFMKNGYIHSDTDGLLLPAYVKDGYIFYYLNGKQVTRDGTPLH